MIKNILQKKLVSKDKIEKIAYSKNAIPYYCNQKNIAGYVVEEDNKFYFIENISLDSWQDGEGFNFGDINRIYVYECEKVHHDEFILFRLEDSFTTLELTYD